MCLVVVPFQGEKLLRHLATPAIHKKILYDILHYLNTHTYCYRQYRKRWSNYKLSNEILKDLLAIIFLSYILTAGQICIKPASYIIHIYKNIFNVSSISVQVYLFTITSFIIGLLLKTDS